MAGSADVVRRALRIALALWLLRWVAGELAAYAGRHWQRLGPSPRDSPAAPGWMPTPSPRALRDLSEP
jgi:hypothetical protein